jgi:plastocyanin
VRRLLVIAFVVLVLGGSTAGAAGYPARLQVTGDEYTLALSRLKVPSGQVKIEFVNFGEDPHDLKLQRIGGTHVYAFPKTASGDRATRTFGLRAGRYHVWCAIKGHRAKGMHAMLRVTRS